jgi:hypothetical protein
MAWRPPDAFRDCMLRLGHPAAAKEENSDLNSRFCIAVLHIYHCVLRRRGRKCARLKNDPDSRDE